MGPGSASILASIRWPESAGGRRTPGYQVGYRQLHTMVVEVGTLGSWIVDDGHHEVRAEAGRVVVVPPECVHRMRWSGPPGKTEWWMIALQDEASPRGTIAFGGPWVPEAATSMRVLELLNAGRPPDPTLQDRIRDQRLALEVVDLLLMSRPVIRTPARRVEPRIREVLRYIDSHLAEDLSRTQLGRVAHLSPTRLHYVFTREIGQSPGRYVAARRLDYVREQLASTEVPVRRIAPEIGFTSADRFARWFRNLTAVTPSDYRRRFRPG